MFDVAFARRMCCSRVWSVSTNPRAPSKKDEWENLLTAQQYEQFLAEAAH